MQALRERLIIHSFSLEDAGVYQCVAESTLADDPVSKPSRESPPTASSSSELLNSTTSDTSLTAKVADKVEAGRVSVGDLVDNAQDTAHLVMGSE